MMQSKIRPDRRPYDSPKLLLYGDIRTITRSVGQKGNADGPPPFGIKTGESS